MHRAFHMLTLNYLFRLIATTCSNSNNPSAPQEPTICGSCHFFTILTPTFLLTKAWATIRVLPLCTPSVLLTLSQVITLTEQRRCCGGLEESALKAPSTISMPAGAAGICCWGLTDEPLPEHCPQPIGATSPRPDPIPWDSPHPDRALSRYKSQAPWASFGTLLPVLWQQHRASTSLCPILPPSLLYSCFSQEHPQSSLHADIYFQVCLKKLNLELPYDPAIPVLGIYLEKNRLRKDTCTPMFIAAPFIIPQTWKQPKCPLTKQWIKKMLYVCMYIYIHTHMAFLAAQSVKNPPVIQETWKTWVQSLGQEDPLEKEMATPLQHSCLENPMDRGAWQATVHGVTKSWTQLSDQHTHIKHLYYTHKQWNIITQL